MINHMRAENLMVDRVSAPHQFRAAGKLAATAARCRRFWRNVVKAVLDPYRPELHYMRGPGPKCREKRAQVRAGGQSASPIASATRA
jgi:hypothetical protein